MVGCYTTGPKHWSVQSRRDIVERGEVIGNGSRLAFSSDVKASSLLVSVDEIPQCRVAEMGRERIREGGSRVSHSWPGTLFSLGMLGGGAYFIGDSFSEGQSTETKLAKGGVGLAAVTIGSIFLGRCLRDIGCGPDEEMEYRESDGGNFKRWRRDLDRRDCSDVPPKPPGVVPITVSAFFPMLKGGVSWEKNTDELGKAEFRIIDTIRAVAAHCGEPEVVVFRADGNKRSTDNDSASSPSRDRDESAAEKFKVASGPIRSPDMLRDETAKKISWKCADEKLRKCLGDRTSRLEQSCTRVCNTEAGGDYCEENLTLALSTPGVSNEERDLAQRQYDRCIRDSEIDTSKTSECKTKCVNKETDKICPRGW